MMSKLASLLMVIVTFGACNACVKNTGPYAKFNKSDMYETITAQVQEQSVVEVDVTCSDGWSPYGSGVAVSPNQILTAMHVIDCVELHVINSPSMGLIKLATYHGPAIHIVAITYDDRKFDMVVDRLPIGSDVDAVRLITKEQVGVFDIYSKVSLDRLKEREEVCVETGLTRTRKCGVVLHSDLKETRLGINVRPGDSGSPVYDRQGRIRGIVVRLRPFANGEVIGLSVAPAAWENLIPGRILPDRSY